MSLGPTNKVCGVYLSEHRSNILSMTLKRVNPMLLHVGDRYRSHKWEVVPYASMPHKRLHRTSNPIRVYNSYIILSYQKIN